MRRVIELDAFFAEVQAHIATEYHRTVCSTKGCPFTKKIRMYEFVSMENSDKHG